MSTPKRWYHTLCYNVGFAGLVSPEAEVMRRFGVTRAFVRYWTEKARDPNFHSGELGGARHCLFTEDAQLVVERVLWSEVLENPFRTNTAFALALNEMGIDVDKR